MTPGVVHRVIIAGAGPVGLCLALDLAWRGIDVLVVEQRPAGEPPSVKCNHVSSRTMETFRRLGFVREIRDVGLPDDYPNDVVIRTRATGHELMRIAIPCRRDRYTSRDGPDTAWPTPEPPHRVNQIFFEPVLFARALANPRITLVNDTRVEAFTQRGDAVEVELRDLATDAIRRVTGRYLVGCDGGRSGIRRAMGVKLSGHDVIQRVQSTYIRAPSLLGRIPTERAWMSYLYSPGRAGNLVAIDGRETWLLHNYLLPGEADFESVDRDACLRALLGVGPDFEYELLAKEDWIGRRLVADRLRDRRVFLCGDAAHLWVPYAGYGMNAGIADAMTLSWQLAACVAGWADEGILDAYESERLPITDQVSRFAMSHAEKAIGERTGIPADIEAATPEGEVARRRVGEAAYALHVQQFACAGLNYGYYYDASPIIAYDGALQPAYTMHDYTASTVPGCRVPHFWLPDGRSLYDAVGPGYTLLRFDPARDVEALSDEARRHGMPLAVLDVPPEARPPEYGHELLLARPDGHVAWRGDLLPEDVAALVDRLRGAPERATASGARRASAR